MLKKILLAVVFGAVAGSAMAADLFGEPRVNVLELNLALDKAAPR